MNSRTIARATARSILLCLLFLATPALAEPPDTEALLTRLDAWFSENSMAAEFGPIETAGPGNFSIEYATFTGRRLNEPVRMEAITIAGADVDADGALTIGRIAFSKLSQAGTNKNGKAYTVAIDGGEASGLFLPDVANESGPLIAAGPSSGRIGPFILTIEGTPAVTIAGVESRSEPDAGRETLASSLEIAGVKIDLLAIGDKDVGQQAEDLDLQTLELSLRMAMNWNSASGRMALDSWRIDAPGHGALDLSVALDGYTGERVRQFRRAGLAAAGEAGKSAEAAREAGKQMMAALGGISLSAATLRFEDGSLTRRALEARAKADGQTAEELVAMLPEMSLSFTQMLDMPEFSQHVADALRTFLSDPKSMTIKLKPAAPAPVAGMIGMALFSPAALVQQLGLEITANE